MFIRAISRLSSPFLAPLRIRRLPLCLFSTYDLQAETQKAIELLQSFSYTNHPPTKEIQFARYQQHDLFQRLEQLSVKQELNTTDLIQSLKYLFEQRYVVPVLYMIYPHLNNLPGDQLISVLQKILVYKPPQLPEVPEPRIINNNEMLFFLLAEIYEPKKMIGWMEKVPFWQDDKELPSLAMGVFTIYNKMSKVEREMYAAKINKCIGVIENSVSDGEFGDEFINILILALELHNPLAEKLLKQRSIQLEQIPPDQLCTLFINMITYQPNGQSSKLVQEKLAEVIEEVVQLDWAALKDLTYLDLWRGLYSKNGYKGIWIKFGNRLMSYTLSLFKKSTFEEPSTSDLIMIVETLDKHYINKKQLLHTLLLKLEPHLKTLRTNELVRLVKALCIYVKIEESYFMHLRKVCDERKLEFTLEQVKQLRNVYSRFRILFSMPF